MLNPFARASDAHALVVAMTGVKMGERFLQIGCEHGGRLAAVAAKVGLSGQAVALVPDEASATRARKGAAHGGVLVDVEVTLPSALSVEDRAFDVAVVDDTTGLVGTMRPEDRVAMIRELLRVLRPGGRVVFISAAPRGGVGGLFTRAQGGPSFAWSGALHESLTADGFRPVRTLAEREGLVFVEAVKPRETKPPEGAGAAG